MDIDDPNFDITLLKKKRVKKGFDLDAALGFDDGTKTKPTEGAVKEEAEEAQPNNAEDILDLDNFGLKKKKSKKPINLEELDVALAETNLDMAFSMTTKKKKKKKVELDDLVAESMAEEKGEDRENVDDNSVSWAGSDRDYTYDELLKRVFEIILDKNPDMAMGRKPKFVMRPPQVLRVGTKKTSFANFLDISKTLHRQPKHLLDFLLAELGTSGSLDGNNQLIIKGRFQPKQIENVLRRYIKEYVTCHTCRSAETILQKDTRLFFLQCESCGSRCSVASIKSGFQAVTGKRAAIRAKTT